MGKLLIVTAPSGSGKSTIIKHLLANNPKTAFSVSATTRTQRPGETHGKEYYFISKEKFIQYIKQGRFVEWEEIYPGQFSGTLKSELKRLWAQKKTILFDIDVVGATDLKKMFPKKSLALFIKPPSLEILKDRLIARNTETPEKIAIRLKRAEMELKYEHTFDKVILNDDLEAAKSQALYLANQFIFGR